MYVVRIKCVLHSWRRNVQYVNDRKSDGETTTTYFMYTTHIYVFYFNSLLTPIKHRPEEGGVRLLRRMLKRRHFLSEYLGNSAIILRIILTD